MRITRPFVADALSDRPRARGTGSSSSPGKHTNMGGFPQAQAAHAKGCPRATGFVRFNKKRVCPPPAPAKTLDLHRDAAARALLNAMAADPEFDAVKLETYWRSIQNETLKACAAAPH